MESRNCKERYNHAEKIATLRILESHNFNYLKTSKQTKVSRPTLRKWNDKYGKEVFSIKSPTEQALIEVDSIMKYNDINILRALYLLRRQTLRKVLDLSEKETKVESLLNILKYVSGEIHKFSETDKSAEDKAIDYVAYITEITFGGTGGNPPNEDQE